MLILALALIAAAPQPQREEPELLVSGDIDNGGFGGPELRYSSIHDESALFVGGRGGWLINHRYVLGLAGYGLATDVDAPGALASNYDIRFGYGGPFFEVIFAPMKVAHFSFMTLFGAGGLNYREKTQHMTWAGETNAVFVAEPSLMIELNVTKFMRIDFGAGYRFVAGTTIEGLTNRDVRGFSGVFGLKFGKF